MKWWSSQYKEVSQRIDSVITQRCIRSYLTKSNVIRKFLLTCKNCVNIKALPENYLGYYRSPVSISYKSNFSQNKD